MSKLSDPYLYQSPMDGLEILTKSFIGQRLEDIQAPAAILDIAVVKRNCALMLHATRTLKVQFRAHVKTHKVSSL